MHFNIKNTSVLISIIIFSLLFSPKNAAQGILINKKVNKSYNKMYTKKSIKRSNQNLSQISKAASLTKYCPPPVDQGKTVTCGGICIAYWMTIREAYQINWQDKSVIDDNMYSIDHIYKIPKHKRKVNCEQTLTNLSTTFEYLKTDGITKEKDSDDGRLDCYINLNQLKNAKRYYIEDYYPLFRWNGRKEKNQIKLIQKQISDGKPVIAVIKLTNSFKKLDDQELWQLKAEDRKTKQYHAITVVAYDDQYRYEDPNGDEQFGAFQILNSWGEEWGKNGMAWIPYTYFGEWVIQGYALEDYNKWGEVAINKKGNQKIRPAVFDTLKNNYTIDLQNKQEITVSLHEQSNSYIYAFYWPTNKRKEVSYLYPKKSTEKPLVKNGESPSFDIVPTKEEKNEDYLYVLYSEHELTQIDRFYDTLNNIRKAKETMKYAPEEQIKQALKTIHMELATKEAVNYVDKKIRFETIANPNLNLVIALPIKVNLFE